LSCAVRHSVVFARGAEGGNPCPVVLGAEKLDADAMQAVAARYGHETGFVLRDADGGLRLRYFVPRHEMSMCVHATIAVATVLLDRGELPGTDVTARTDSGDVLITWDDGVPPQVTVEQQPPVFGPPLPIARELEPVCGLPIGSIDERAPVRAVSVSRPKLIVSLRMARDVHAATPDHPRLWELCRRYDATGAYLFAPHDDGDPAHVVARQFPVDAGYPRTRPPGSPPARWRPTSPT
jgi:PhzF family phenazine biosynthesis protein